MSPRASDGRARRTLRCFGGELVEVWLSSDEEEYLRRQFAAGLLVPVDDGPDSDRVYFLPPAEAEALVTSRRRLRPSMARMREREAKGERILLGEDCPPLQLRLFHVLCDGQLFWTRARDRKRLSFAPVTMYLEHLGPLAEDEVAEAVYQLEPLAMEGPKALRHRTNLRRLQSDLNNRLLTRKTPFRVVRPVPGWLLLWDTTDADAPARVRAERLGHRREPRRGKEGDGGAARVRTLEECLIAIREFLAGGPKGSAELDGHCAAHGFRPTTIRRARRSLGVKPYREGFGGEGRWLVRLP
jgi:hypothetical protein